MNLELALALGIAFVLLVLAWAFFARRAWHRPPDPLTELGRVMQSAAAGSGGAGGGPGSGGLTVVFLTPQHAQPSRLDPGQCGCGCDPDDDRHDSYGGSGD